ncbi:hypothetical protein J2X35_001629 [Mesorhizobium sp. BE184]|nr:hypothetical protein [Mesorhizobium sp. BE184]
MDAGYPKNGVKIARRNTEYGSLSEQEPSLEEQAAAAALEQAAKPEPKQIANDAVARWNRGLPPRTQEEVEALYAYYRGETRDAAPRTLYVRRDVVNAAEIAAWARKQGIPDLVDDLHVTIVYSRAPLDWIKAGNASEWGNENGGKLTIPPGGPRVVEPLGNMTAVLMFASSQLCWRHEEIVKAGASHDFEDYQPHISLTKAAIDLGSIEPYRGKIVLGAEIFEEVMP